MDPQPIPGAPGWVGFVEGYGGFGRTAANGLVPGTRSEFCGFTGGLGTAALPGLTLGWMVDHARCTQASGDTDGAAAVILASNPGSAPMRVGGSGQGDSAAEFGLRFRLPPLNGNMQPAARAAPMSSPPARASCSNPSRSPPGREPRSASTRCRS